MDLDRDADDRHGRPADFVTTWQHVIQDPRAFFAAMPETGGLADPMRFLALCAGVNALGTLLVHWSIAQAVGAFAALVVGSVVLAAALTLVAQQVFGGRAGFEPVFRVVAFASAPAVLFWVPWLAAIACLYAWFLQVRGIERVQGFDATRAALATTLAWGAMALVVRGFSGRSLGWLGTS